MPRAMEGGVDAPVRSRAVAVEGPTRALVAPLDQDPALERDLAAAEPNAGWSRRAILLCVAVYALLAVVAYLPVSPISTTHLPAAGADNPAGADPFQMMWFLTYVPYALTHGLSIFHSNYIDFPNGVNLADNTSVPLLGILAWPITATLGPIATFNLLLRLAFALSATSMFLVLRRWCTSWKAPFLAGLLYAFGPYMTSQALHLDLLFVPIPPLLVLLGDELVRRQRWRPGLLGVAIGLAAAAQFLISQDVLSGCGVVALCVAACLLVRNRHLVRERLAYALPALIVATTVFCLVCGYPIYEMLFGPGHPGGPVVPLNVLQGNSADLLGSLVPISNQLLVPAFVTHFSDYLVGGNLSENGTYLGIPLLVVLVIIVRRLRHDPIVRIFAFGAAVALVLSLGAHLVIGTWQSPIPLPGFVFAHLPLLDDTIPARYALYVAVFTAMILAIGVERLWLTAPVAPSAARDRGTARRRRGRRRVAFVGGVVALSLLPNAPFVSVGLPWAASLPANLAHLVPNGSVVAPDPATSPLTAQAMAWQAQDLMDFRILGGYANVAVPGQSYGQRDPEPTPPAYLETMPADPQLGSLYLRPALARAQVLWVGSEMADLLAYLARYRVSAVVYTGAAPPLTYNGSLPAPSSTVLVPASYWYLSAALGHPRVVTPTYVIWVSGGHGWSRGETT